MNQITPQPLIVLEACVESLDEARSAVAAGATRVELCSRLDVGGITPDLEMVARTTPEPGLRVHVMIRTRGGSFWASGDELKMMLRDIAAVRAAGAAGIVTGVLTDRNTVDMDAMRRLVDAARPLSITFHRAFDAAVNLDSALDALLQLQIDRVLTSGGASTALSGADRLADLRRRAGDGIVIMAGGKVRAPHVVELVRRSGVREVHARPERTVPLSRDRGRPFTGDGSAAGTELDPEGIRALARALRTLVVT